MMDLFNQVTQVVIVEDFGLRATVTAGVQHFLHSAQAAFDALFLILGS